MFKEATKLVGKARQKQRAKARKVSPKIAPKVSPKITPKVAPQLKPKGFSPVKVSLVAAGIAGAGALAAKARRSNENTV